jgi:GT2 family glycosyltransferase
MSPIDVIIPVYNAPELTRRCIDSVLTHLDSSMGRIHIQDDASDEDTRAMLAELPQARIEVHRALENRGFGASVNEAMQRTGTPCVLVLNSDVEISADILPPLYAALAADARLAVIIPAGNDYARYDLERYSRTPGGYIPTHRLQGHAFLVRRDVFLELGGFDPAYGRGYYEDVDLGRRLDRHGWRIGVHPEVHVYHAGGGSFGRGQAFRELVRRNRSLYYARHPGARRNVLLLTGRSVPGSLPPALVDATEDVFHQGGYIHWLTPESTQSLSCLQMRHDLISPGAVAKLVLRGWRSDMRISDIWMAADAPRLLRAFLTLWGYCRNIEVRLWEKHGSLKK